LDGGAKDGASPFPDTAGKWFDAAAAWAAAKGVVNGVGGRFDGDTPVTREQLAVMLYRYAALIGKATGNAAELSRFRDAESVSPWAAEAMAWAVGRGLINGVSPATLAPRAGATRAQTAAILMRFCENVLK
ncbi:MAG: S-layer homology domain-containing protein, partial [Oscillospiraceae bacterium]|nr:S-layer homology domain-containing protein [Oscillospiraceae bacterium]